MSLHVIPQRENAAAAGTCTSCVCDCLPLCTSFTDTAYATSGIRFLMLISVLSPACTCWKTCGASFC